MRTFKEHVVSICNKDQADKNKNRSEVRRILNNVEGKRAFSKRNIHVRQ